MVFFKRPVVALRALFEMSMINVTPDAQPIRPALVRRHPGLRRDVANRRVSGSLAPVWIQQAPYLSGLLISVRVASAQSFQQFPFRPRYQLPC